MFTKVFLPLLALAGLVFGVGAVVKQRNTPVLTSKPVLQPPQKPEKPKEVIFGFGLVEPQRENIPIGTVVPGAVMEVYVDGRPGFDPPHKKVGDPVKKGERLFRIDDRDLLSEMKVREASLLAAQAQLHRLEQMPRPEDLPPAIAAVDEARARLLDSEAAYNRDLNLFQKKMLAASDFDKDRYTMQAAQGHAWPRPRPTLPSSRRRVEGRHRRADGRPSSRRKPAPEYQDHARPADCPGARGWRDPPGQRPPRPVRGHGLEGADDRPGRGQPVARPRGYRRERPLPLPRGGAAWANIKGQQSPRFSLKFVRVEPYVIPKKSLTGDNTERVDTRALQVLYALPVQAPAKVYVGQQMEVFLSVGDVEKAEGPGVDAPRSLGNGG